MIASSGSTSAILGGGGAFIWESINDSDRARARLRSSESESEGEEKEWLSMGE